MSLDEVRRLHLRQQLTESQQADFDELYGAEEDDDENLFGERVEADEEDDDYEDDEFLDEVERRELPARLAEEADLIVDELDEVERRRMEYYIRQHPDLLAELYRRQQEAQRSSQTLRQERGDAPGRAQEAAAARQQHSPRANTQARQAAAAQENDLPQRTGN